MGLAMTKSSILFFYLRFPSPRAFKAACYLVLFIAVGNGLTAGFAFLYLCQPIEKHWNPYVEGKCADHVLPFWVAAIVNMATDGIILLLPIWLLWPLRLGVAKMLSVLCILMAGGLYVRSRPLSSLYGLTKAEWQRVRRYDLQGRRYTQVYEEHGRHLGLYRQLHVVVRGDEVATVDDE